MALLCGCYYVLTSPGPYSDPIKHYLPRVDLSAHTTILSTTSRTQLTQMYINPSSEEPIKECVYEFPLYDGVSVVGFTCRIGSRIIKGIVKEKEKARAVYKAAVGRGETAGLFQQLDNSDIFQTRIGNIPAGQKVIVEICYIGELKHDAETDGIRFTIPTSIAPRYGTSSHDSGHRGGVGANDSGGIRITVDASLAEGSFIRGIQSPSHPIAVTMGSTSTSMQEEPRMHTASATLTLGSAALDKDFVLVILAKDTATPRALLETHLSIPHQRALMVTLVPRFALPPSRPEIIFVVDRSGSMEDKIPALRSALKVFLKSLPIGVRFNICSFGSHHTFLWPKSQAYSQKTLTDAMRHVESFDANCGGTETYSAIKATIESRYPDLPLEVMLLTDGQISEQEQLFQYLNQEVGNSEAPIRVFSLGIGNAVSHALIEGIARAGNGLAQSAGENEKLDSKVVRMLKAGLSPHIADYTLEVKYEDEADKDDGFELVERVPDGLKMLLSQTPIKKNVTGAEPRPISLFDTSADPDKEENAMPEEDGQGRYSHLPTIPIPNLLQAPHKIPSLFPFNRTTVYLLMGPQSSQKTPKAIVLRATSAHAPLELEIPVQVQKGPGETIHQLAAKKAVGDLEEGRGWIFDARDENGTLIRERFESRFDEMVEREAVRLGVNFQVGGKWCSFVAVEAGDREEQETRDPASYMDQNASDNGQEGGRICKSFRTRSSEKHERAALNKYSDMSELVLQADKKLVGSASNSSLAGSSTDYDPTISADPATVDAPTVRSRLASGYVTRHLRGPGPSSRMAFKAPSPSVFSTVARKMPKGTLFGSARSAPSAEGVSVQSAGSSSYLPKKAKLGSPLAMVDQAPQAVLFNRLAASKTSSPGMMVKESYATDEDEEMECEEDDETPAKAVPEADDLDKIVALQTFEGWWKLDDFLLAVLKLGRAKAERARPGKVSLEVWATVLAVRFLEGRLSERENAWELVVEKARGWLDGQGMADEVSVELFEIAKGLLG